MRNVIAMTMLSLSLLHWATAGGAAADDWSWEEGLAGHEIEGDVFEDDGTIYPGWLCHECRDPIEFPVDYAAAAFNAYWGEDPWAASSALGIPFRIYDGQLNWVVVWFEDVLFDAPTLLPNTMAVQVRLPNGQIVTITILQSGPDMPVGEPSSAPDSGDGAEGGDSDGSSGEADDDYGDPEEDLPEGPDYEGEVEIVDPDEYGEFPPLEEEL